MFQKVFGRQLQLAGSLSSVAEIQEYCKDVGQNNEHLKLETAFCVYFCYVSLIF